jgi:NAD(P)-dependent dehydrogenase (short-subunit alcohol dehydrogenase family)
LSGPIQAVTADLSHRSAIITGAARGIGAAMAAALAGAGARLSLTDVDIGTLRRTRDTIYTDSGNDALAVFEADVAKYVDAQNVVEETCARYGSADIVINNAALGLATIRPDFINRPVRFWEIDPRVWTRLFGVNFNGAFFLEHVAVPRMVKAGWGRVINVTTTFQAMLSFEAYGPSKAALEAHSYIIARALAGTGVTVNAVSPGGPADTEQRAEDVGVPRDRLLAPSIMGPPITWLCSDSANGMSGRRITAALWDASLPAAEAAVRASRDIAWPELITPVTLAGGDPVPAAAAPPR